VPTRFGLCVCKMFANGDCPEPSDSSRRATYSSSARLPTLEMGADYYTKRHDPERQARRLTRQLEQLGYTVTIAPAA
jgi:hypothetical protein